MQERLGTVTSAVAHRASVALLCSGFCGYCFQPRCLKAITSQCGGFGSIYTCRRVRGSDGAAGRQAELLI